MLWTELGASIVVGIVAMAAVILAKRLIHADSLGSVSDHWVARHRGDAS